MEKIEFLATKEQTLFEAILEYRKTLNFSMLQTVLRKKDVKINNKKVAENLTVKKGDLITVFLNNKKQKEIEKVFEDDNIIIAIKPQGMEVTKQDKTFLESLCMEEILNATACHRLDKNTEGLVVFAKNETAKNILMEAFKDHQITKNYFAIVSGKVNKNGEILENYLKKERNFAKICKKTYKNAKFSKLEYKVKKQKDDLYLIDIDLFTGRFHQIRVQLANKNIFVLGDEKYGDKSINKKYHKNKQLLCSYKLKFKELNNDLEYLNNKEFEIKPSFDFDNIKK